MRAYKVAPAAEVLLLFFLATSVSFDFHPSFLVGGSTTSFGKATRMGETAAAGDSSSSSQSSSSSPSSRLLVQADVGHHHGGSVGEETSGDAIREREAKGDGDEKEDNSNGDWAMKTLFGGPDEGEYVHGEGSDSEFSGLVRLFDEQAAQRQARLERLTFLSKFIRDAMDLQSKPVVSALVDQLDSQLEKLPRRERTQLSSEIQRLHALPTGEKKLQYDFVNSEYISGL